MLKCSRVDNNVDVTVDFGRQPTNVTNYAVLDPTAAKKGEKATGDRGPRRHHTPIPSARETRQRRAYSSRCIAAARSHEKNERTLSWQRSAAPASSGNRFTAPAIARAASTALGGTTMT